jgi:hypothetical protein
MANGAKPPTNRALNRWVAAEIDGTTVAVRDWVIGDEALLDWNDEATAWECSECGLQAARPSQAIVTCVHVTSGLRFLPAETAVEIGCDLVKRRRGKTVIDKAAVVDVAAIDEARAAIARAEGKAVREKYADQDDHHRRIASEVTVRQMTDEDRAKLEERRRKKSRAFAFD